MEVSKEIFFQHALNAGISQSQAEIVWSSLKKNEEHSSSLISKWMFYFGAMIVISAMTWLMNTSWELFGGGGIFLISLIYSLLFFCIGVKLWNKPDLKIPAGLFITMAVCMTPLIVYGIESYLQIWPPDNYPDYFRIVKTNWVFMELATILMSILALSFFPFPFLTAPIFFSAWLLTMDIIPLLLGNEITWQQNRVISLCFGIILILISYCIHRKRQSDYAFWGYLFGLITFWGTFTELVWWKSEEFFLLYLMINILLMFLSILLKNRVFMVFGAIGSFIYFSHLAYEVFADSIWFPFVFSLIGIIIIYLGILYQKNSGWIARKIVEKIPLKIRELLPYDEE